MKAFKYFIMLIVFAGLTNCSKDDLPASPPTSPPISPPIIEDAYFPLEVGHLTKYIAVSYHNDIYDGWWVYSTEDWKIVQIDSMYSSFTLLITSHYYMRIDYVYPRTDTTKLDETYQNEYTINISENGQLSYQDCPGGESYICDCIQDCINEGNPIIIYHEDSSEDTLTFNKNWSKYELTKGYGISYLHTYTIGAAVSGYEYTRRD